jgi:hypothetical protein
MVMKKDKIPLFEIKIMVNDCSSDEQPIAPFDQKLLLFHQTLDTDFGFHVYTLLYRRLTRIGS